MVRIRQINKTSDWKYRLIWFISDENNVVIKGCNQYFTDEKKMDKKYKKLWEEGHRPSIFYNEHCPGEEDDYIGREINTYSIR